MSEDDFEYDTESSESVVEENEESESVVEENKESESVVEEHEGSESLVDEPEVSVSEPVVEQEEKIPSNYEKIDKPGYLSTDPTNQYRLEKVQLYKIKGSDPEKFVTINGYSDFSIFQAIECDFNTEINDPKYEILVTGPKVEDPKGPGRRPDIPATSYIENGYAIIDNKFFITYDVSKNVQEKIFRLSDLLNYVNEYVKSNNIFIRSLANFIIQNYKIDY